MLRVKCGLLHVCGCPLLVFKMSVTDLGKSLGFASLVSGLSQVLIVIRKRRKARALIVPSSKFAESSNRQVP